MTTKHPIQPIEIDSKGVVRFKKNSLVCYLLYAGPFDLNHLAMLPNIPDEDHEQLAQLIGYSVSGFGGLNYANPETVAEADAVVQRLLKK